MMAEYKFENLQLTLTDSDLTTYPESRCQMTNWDALRKYCLGGRGIVTLENPNTGKHHTYEFRRPNNPKDFDVDVMFIYVLVKDNLWIYVGAFHSAKNLFRLTRASRYTHDSEIVKGVRYIVNRISGKSNKVVEPMKFYHEGVCAICGRKLTSPKSIESGIGPRCKKVLEAIL